MLNREQFIERFSTGVHLLDGATGTELRKAGMPADCCAEQWIAGHPGEIIRLQQAYAEAGSEIIYAPTFLAQPLALKKWGLEKKTEAINRELVRLSRTAALGCLVAGNLTTMRGSTDDPEAMRNAYRCQMKALIAGDVDLIAAETLMDADEAKIILELAEELSAPAVMISFTCRGDRLFSGEDLTETLRAAEEADAAAVGINCVPASAELPELIGRLRGMTGLPLVCKPNAGYPVQGQYPIGIQEFTSLLLDCAGKGANLIGGCCGTSPDYIRNIRRCLRQEEHPD